MLFLSFLNLACVFDSGHVIKPWTLRESLCWEKTYFLPLSGYFPTKFPSGTTGKNYLPLGLLSIFFFSSLLNVQVTEIYIYNKNKHNKQKGNGRGKKRKKGRCREHQSWRVCGRVYPESLDPSPCDLLAVIEFYPLEAVTTLQVLQGSICDQWAVVQFNHFQLVMGAGPIPQVTNSIVCDQLTVRQTLQPNRARKDTGTLHGIFLAISLYTGRKETF